MTAPYASQTTMNMMAMSKVRLGGDPGGGNPSPNNIMQPILQEPTVDRGS